MSLKIYFRFLYAHIWQASLHINRDHSKTVRSNPANSQKSAKVFGSCLVPCLFPVRTKRFVGRVTGPSIGIRHGRSLEDLRKARRISRLSTSRALLANGKCFLECFATVGATDRTRGRSKERQACVDRYTVVAGRLRSRLKRTYSVYTAPRNQTKFAS